MKRLKLSLIILFIKIIQGESQLFSQEVVDNAAFYLQEIAQILGIQESYPENPNNVTMLMDQITAALKRNIPNLHIFSKNDKFL